jgi:polyisoprenoid-binding protein YceI
VSRRRKLLVALPLAALLALGAAFAVFAIRGSDEPPPPALAEPEPAGARAQAGSGAQDGARELRVAGGSFVGYRVRETFASIGVVDAVGRTQDVEGTARADGRRLVAADLEADLTTLRSDEARRDAALRTRGIETDRFPTARFTLAAPAAVVPAAGERARATVRGRLELHGQTREVRARVQAQRRGAGLELVGEAPIAFADFGIEPPSVAGFVTVRDEGALEFRVVLEPR